MRQLRLTSTVCFLAFALLAIPVISVSTSSTAVAQILDFTNDPPPNPRDAFLAEVEAKENSTIVSGFEVEESREPTADEVDSFGTALSVISDVTEELTIPSGTLSLFSAQSGQQLLFLATLPVETISGDLVSSEFPVGFIAASLSAGFQQELALIAFEPDPALGNAFGFCVSDLTGLGSIRVFDGDELIFDRGLGVGVDQIEVSFDDRTACFMTLPGQTITRVEVVVNVVLSEFQVAFCEEPELPPEEISSQDCLKAIAAEVGALADAATDSSDAYALNVACAALHFSAKDRFYEEGGNRLSREGGNVFTGAAYAICYLEHTGVEGTEDIVDRILEKLEQIVDDEIDFAIANGGTPQFIERAEDFAEVAQWIDEDLDNPVVATIAYKLAWANAFFATY